MYTLKASVKKWDYLSRLVRERDDGNGNENVTKQKVQCVEQWLCTSVIIRGTFLCRPLQINDVK